MRLWHEKLIPLLPRQQLLGQHREIAALRGKGWGKKHATVDYVFTHPYYKLFQFHLLVMREMERRGYTPDPLWYNPLYRGKMLPPLKVNEPLPVTHPLYPEHNDAYLEECLTNLAQKGVYLPKP
ncbi:TIGR02328 family protein [Enterococcus hulanensis]|uniref:TIGR02328 family protein n=1 Tax=Enterococcus hulanensis TaxID=2559929 RepID=UPI0010F61ABB|nr:TIGR02328 family protein [Enterococcus hulanensis]